MNLISDLFRIVVPNDWCDENSKHGANMCTEDVVGNFRKIIDESVAEDKPGAKGSRTTAGGVKKGPATLWR